ncbi:hypothetical protein [Citrobacter braakii]|uniref:hypothetical protein n=1 Tax=Citrobacter braakii TaxID=57706 RepID=UPI000CEE1C4D|nr:hypothetical protein [Citrobacter braakii]PPS52030.1 hypothetical protein BWR12_04645 [Citrobacter braakii]
MIMTVYRDSNGKVINIGAWDYMEVSFIDDDGVGNSVWVSNPLPDGATSKEEEVVVRDDGGLAAANP